MEAPLCPRCGMPVFHFSNDYRPPYCRECGWNLDEVEKRLHKNAREMFWVLGAAALFIGIPALSRGATWKGALFVAGIVGLLAVAGLTSKARGLRHFRKVRDVTSQKEGFDPSSAVPDSPPARVEEYLAVLRSLARPRAVRLNLMSRTTVWIARLILLAVAYLPIHDLLLPAKRIGLGSSTALCVFLLLGVGLLWYLLPRSVKKEPRLPLLQEGEIAMARTSTLPFRLRLSGKGVGFEFRDADGKLIRGKGPNHTSFLLQGTFVPVFYEAQNPENFVPDCALNYELVLPKSGPLLPSRRSASDPRSE